MRGGSLDGGSPQTLLPCNSANRPSSTGNVVVNVAVVNADYAITESIKDRGAFGIGGDFVDFSMCPAINFDDELQLAAKKIGIEAIDRRLANKLEIAENEPGVPGHATDLDARRTC